MEEKEKTAEKTEVIDNELPLDKTVRLMSPTRMVVRRFFRSRLSIVGLIMVVGLFIFSFLGPVFYTEWGEIELDESGKTEYSVSQATYTVNGKEYTLRQTTEKSLKDNFLDAPSAEHILGTDNEGYDIFVRLMYGGRISLIVSFIAVFLITAIGVVMGGIAGFFGGVIDNIIMRVCDVLICLPGVPILLIISTILDASEIDAKYRIYLLMIYLTFISWPGTARLVRGQILSLREQEYMVAAEAMGYSVPRKIFKHLVPNVMPQLIVQMSLSLGSMILYEATLSYLNLGVKAPYAAWGTMINIISTNQDILQNHLNVWVPAGVCIVIAVLGFNFIGDGLRDALDPKARR
ncbi:MAG: ABC transporter permease [Clostridia bacterium]|nr:ABC transporter permease [Clostridia bacterium]MBQ9848412.1 ABC transporter permease [Clostridia bacterium]